MKPAAASFNQRLLAHSIDLTFMLPLVVALNVTFSEHQRLFWLSCLLVYHTYFVLFEFSRYEATPGKMLLKLKVSGIDGQTVQMQKVIFRSILKWISLLSLFGGFFMIYFHPKSQALHDLLTGTWVISEIGSEANW